MQINLYDFQSISNFQKLGTSELSSLNSDAKRYFECSRPKGKEIKLLTDFIGDFNAQSEYETVTKGELHFIERTMKETLYIQHEKDFSINQNVFADLAQRYNYLKDYYETNCSGVELTQRMKILDKSYDNVLSDVAIGQHSGLSCMQFDVQQAIDRHNTCLVTGEGNYNANGLGMLEFDFSGFRNAIHFIQKKVELSVKAMGQYAKDLIKNGDFDLSTDSGKEEFQSALDQYAKSNNFLDRTDFKNLNELADSISNLERSGDKKLVLSKINTFSKMKFSASFINMLNDYFDVYLRWYDVVGSKGSYFTWK